MGKTVFDKSVVSIREQILYFLIQPWNRFVNSIPSKRKCVHCLVHQKILIWSFRGSVHREETKQPQEGIRIISEHRSWQYIIKYSIKLLVREVLIF